MDLTIDEKHQARLSATWNPLSPCILAANAFLSRKAIAHHGPGTGSEGEAEDHRAVTKSSLDLKWLAQKSPSHLSSSDDIAVIPAPGKHGLGMGKGALKSKEHSHPLRKLLAKLRSTFRQHSDRLTTFQRAEAAMAPTTSANLDTLLQQASPTISDIFLSRYGNVGLSIGLLKDGEQAFHNVGQASIGGPSPSNETTYLISSMTKPIVALAMFILVNDRRYNIAIDTPVSDILPELKESKGNFLHHANRNLRISDLLDLRSEFHKGTNLWESPNGHVPWQTIDPIMSLLCEMPANEGFATETSFVNDRNYVNECYCLIGTIIEQVTHQPWTKFIQERIFEPLGMKNTSIGVREAARRESPERFANSHSARVEETLAALKDFTKSTTPSYTQIEDYVASWSFVPPQPAQIRPSETLHGTESLGSTPLAAAAGIMSTTTDILIFSRRLIEVYNSSKEKPLDTELDGAMASMLKYVEVLPETYTYAAGWNRVLLPWNPSVLDPKPRVPGADGDNIRRLEAAMKEGCKDWSPSRSDTQEYTQKAWPFFAHDSAEAAHSSTSQDLALYHGGNMVGANSFWFLVPSQNLAVVVLCNTRGFFLDAANLSCMVLADALYDGTKSGNKSPSSFQVTNYVKSMLSKTQVLSQRIVASYLWEVVKYEDKLAKEFPNQADNKTYAHACVGTYRFCEGIFATISTGENGGLTFQLYGKGFAYPLRVRKTATASLNMNTDRITMTFAMPMGELTLTGVGGSNRLEVEDFVIVFDGKNEGGKFKRFTWNFARAKSVRGSLPPVFSFERV